ncbi:MAG: DUF1045 domain-containing protein, partial [Panacagrimonas sp.]
MSLNLHSVSGDSRPMMPTLSAVGPPSDVPRYAIRYAPAPDSALALRARAWFDAESWSGPAWDQGVIPVLSEGERLRLTAVIASAGLSCNLADPFELHDPAAETSLLLAASRLARTLKPFELQLQVCDHQRMIGLGLGKSSEQINELKSACVRGLSRFAASRRGFPPRICRTQWHVATPGRAVGVITRSPFLMPLTVCVPNSALRARVRQHLHLLFSDVLT